MLKKVKKAVVLLAGFGTRCLPFTKSLPKCMININNTPAIDYIIRELIASDIEEAIFVLPKYCNSKIVLKYFKKNRAVDKFLIKNSKIDLMKQINSLNNKIKIKAVYTSKANGTGGAVLSASKYLKKQPFAVLNGDDIFISEKPVLKKIMEVYESTGYDVLATINVNEEEKNKYGICILEDMFVKDIIEKPFVPVNSNEALIGRYVLNSNFLSYLKKTEPKNNGEIYLTEAMKIKAKIEKDVVVKRIDATRLDCGSKLGIIKANLTLGLKDMDIKENLQEFINNL